MTRDWSHAKVRAVCEFGDGFPCLHHTEPAALLFQWRTVDGWVYRNLISMDLLSKEPALARAAVDNVFAAWADAMAAGHP
jgi:hypothetical protein